MRCEVCGAETGRVHEVMMEGSVVKTCDSCKDLGEEVDKKGAQRRSSSKKPAGGGRRGRSIYDEMEELVDDYPSRIRAAREGLGMTQEELAKRINEKRSLVRKLEKGDKVPEDDVVTKLEGALDVELHGELGEADFEPGSGGGDVSFGDVVRIKKKDEG